MVLDRKDVGFLVKMFFRGDDMATCDCPERSILVLLDELPVSLAKLGTPNRSSVVDVLIMLSKVTSRILGLLMGTTGWCGCPGLAWLLLSMWWTMWRRICLTKVGDFAHRTSCWSMRSLNGTCWGCCYLRWAACSHWSMRWAGFLVTVPQFTRSPN